MGWNEFCCDHFTPGMLILLRHALSEAFSVQGGERRRQHILLSSVYWLAGHFLFFYISFFFLQFISFFTLLRSYAVLLHAFCCFLLHASTFFRFGLRCFSYRHDLHTSLLLFLCVCVSDERRGKGEERTVNIYGFW